MVGRRRRQGFMSAYDDPDGMLSGDSMEEEEEEEEQEGGGPARSALEESIKRKGINSYYYAHSRKNGKCGCA